MAGEKGICEICGRAFVKANRASRVCSDECRRLFKREYMQAYMREYYAEVIRPARLRARAARKMREAGLDAGREAL